MRDDFAARAAPQRGGRDGHRNDLTAGNGIIVRSGEHEKRTDRRRVARPRPRIRPTIPA
ncbi:protein of unknown function [Burkholderia multivorans]